jgi:two-component system chemotaxis sensor kinase CheA
MSVAASDICADFLVEAREIVDGLGGQVVALEQSPGDRHCLDAIFRGFHTIKGGAGFLGFPEMVALCHAVEDRLNDARTGDAAMDAITFDATQQAIDLLSDMLDAIGAGVACTPAPAALFDALHAAAVAPLPPGRRRGRRDGCRRRDRLRSAARQPARYGGIPGVVPAPAAPAPPVARPPAPSVGRTAAARAKNETETTVRVDVRRLDAMIDLVGELVLARNRLKSIRPRLRDETLHRAVSQLDVATSRLQSAVMAARMQPVGRVFARFPKLARDVARQLANRSNWK